MNFTKGRPQVNPEKKVGLEELEEIRQKRDELDYKKQRKLETEIMREEYEKQCALFRSVNSKSAKV